MSGSLYLYPADTWQTPPLTEAVLDALRALDMLGEPYDDSRWLAGDGLMQQVIFTGCSPYLEFTPPTDGSKDFCHLGLAGPFAIPRLFTGPNTLNPRCPSCKNRVIDWRPLAETYHAAPETTWTCAHCSAAQRIDRLRWRHHAAFGRLFVEIRHVFPAEGMPSDELLMALEQTTGKAWSYAWAAPSAP